MNQGELQTESVRSNRSGLTVDHFILRKKNVCENEVDEPDIIDVILSRSTHDFEKVRSSNDVYKVVKSYETK